jgi:hypothetical protein
MKYVVFGTYVDRRYSSDQQAHTRAFSRVHDTKEAANADALYKLNIRGDFVYTVFVAQISWATEVSLPPSTLIERTVNL